MHRDYTLKRAKLLAQSDNLPDVVIFSRGDQACARILQYRADFFAATGRIERHDDRTRAEDGLIDYNPFRAVVGQNWDPVPRFDAHTQQAGAQTADRFGNFVPRIIAPDLAALFFKVDAIPVFPGLILKGL